MACMEHDCIDCGYMEMDNSRGPSICPKCGGDMRHTFDEVPECDYDRNNEDPEEDY